MISFSFGVHLYSHKCQLLRKQSITFILFQFRGVYTLSQTWLIKFLQI